MPSPTRTPFLAANLPIINHPAHHAGVPQAGSIELPSQTAVHSTHPSAKHWQSRLLRFSGAAQGNTKTQWPLLTYQQLYDKSLRGRKGNLAVYELTNPSNPAQKQTVYLIQRPHSKSVCAGILVPGAQHETDGEHGAFHFLEHMMFKHTTDGDGNTKFINGQFERTMERHHMQINAATLEQGSRFYYSNGDPSYTLRGLENLAYLIQCPQFDPDEVEKERKAVIEEILQYGDDLWFQIQTRLRQDLMSPHPSAIDELGTVASVEKISAVDLTAMHRLYFGPNNRKIVVIGNFDRETVLKRLARTMNVQSDYFETEAVKPPPTTPTPRNEPVEAEIYSPLIGPRHTKVVWGYLGPSSHNAFDSMVFEVLGNMIAGSSTSPGEQELVQQKEWATESSADVIPYPVGNLMTLDVTARASRVNVVEHHLQQYINDLQSGDFSPEALRRVKKEMKAAYLTAMAEQYSMFEFVCDAIENNTLKDLYDDRYLHMLASIKPKDLQRVASQYLIPSRKAAYRIFPVSVREATTKTLRSRQGSTVRFSGTHSSGDQLFTTKEGLKFVFRPAPESHDMVSLSMVFPGGHSIEAIPGEMAVIQETLERQNQRYNSQQMANHLAEHDLVLRTDTTNDFQRISLDAITTKIKEDHIVIQDNDSILSMFDLLTAILTEPNYTKFDTAKTTTLIHEQTRQVSREDPEEDLRMTHLEKMYPPSHREGLSDRRLTRPRNLSRITPSHLLQRHRSVFKPKGAVLTVVGPADYTTLKQKVIALSAAMAQHNTGITPTITHLGTQRRLRKSRIYTKTRRDGLNQTYIKRSWSTPGRNSLHDELALIILSKIMDGGNLSSRLFSRFREGEDGGLCYNVMAIPKINVDNGRFTLYISTSHNNTPRVLRTLDEEIDALFNADDDGHPIDEEEFEWAKASCRHLAQLETESLMEQSVEMALHTALNHPSQQDLLEALEHFTLEDFNTALQRLLKQPSHTTMVTTRDVARACSLTENDYTALDDWHRTLDHCTLDTIEGALAESSFAKTGFYRA